MHWYSYCIMSFMIIALAGFGLNASKRNGHGMVYSFVMLSIWTALYFYTGGYIAR